MKVGDLLHAPRDVPWPRRAAGIAVGLFFVVVITQHEAEQEPWHHNVSNPQHGEVAACGTEEGLELSSWPNKR